jgi:hypothetical protein
MWLLQVRKLEVTTTAMKGSPWGRSGPTSQVIPSIHNPTLAGNEGGSRSQMIGAQSQEMRGDNTISVIDRNATVALS